MFDPNSRNLHAIIISDTNVACMGSMYNVGFKHVGIVWSSTKGSVGFKVSCGYYKNGSHVQCEI
jgi:hypothetical protein